jgi:hypothetical protein
VTFLNVVTTFIYTNAHHASARHAESGGSPVGLRAGSAAVAEIVRQGWLAKQRLGIIGLLWQDRWADFSIKGAVRPAIGCNSGAARWHRAIQEAQRRTEGSRRHGGAGSRVTGARVLR